MMQSLGQIAEWIFLATGYDVGALRTKRRDTFRVAARQLFCYYARASGYSCGAIGEFLNIDHVTASYGSRRIKEMKETDDIIKSYINRYEIMSNKKQVIELCPPDYSDNREGSTVTGFVCPKCSGRGYVMEYGEREPNRIDCPRCGGCGKLRAIVSIWWEGDV
jgi:hypothetical protein